MSGFEFFVSLRYCFGHQRDRLSRLITLLSGCGLVLGVGMMITVLAVMSGFDRELKDKILVVVPHIKLYQDEGISDWRKLSDQLSTHPKVDSVHPYSELEVLLRSRNDVEPMLLYAIDPEAESASGSFGEIIGAKGLADIATEDNSLLLGSGIAAKMGLSTGDQISVLLFGDQDRALTTARFKVVELFHSGTEADQRLGIIDLRSLSSIAGQSSIPTGVRVQTSDIFDSRSIAYDLLNRIAPSFRASTWAMTHGSLYELIQTSRNLVSLIVFLILAIAAFNLVATLMISSADKQSELAILNTLGATPTSLSMIFALQGLFVGVIGSSVGAAFGILLTTQLGNITKLIESITGQSLLQTSAYPLDYLPSQISVLDIMIVVLAAIFLSVLAAVYPAWRVSKVDPAQILRYE